MVANVARGIIKPSAEGIYVYTTVPDASFSGYNVWSDRIYIPELIGAHGFCGYCSEKSDGATGIYTIQYFDKNNKWCNNGRNYSQGGLQFNPEIGAIRLNFPTSQTMYFNGTWDLYIW